MKHIGNLIIEKGDTRDFSKLTEVTGNLYIYSNAKLDALQSVGGDLSIYDSAKLDALQSVGGYLYIYSNAKLDALQSVGGYLSIYSSAKLDALQSVGGNLSINSNAKLDAPLLQSVGGDLSINSNAKLDAPLLQSVGGYLSINSNAKLDAPLLQSVGGNLSINSSAKLDALQSVGGYLYINSSAKLDALQSVGGNLYIHSSAKLDAPFLNNVSYKSIDGYLFIIKSTKTKGDITIYSGYNAKGVKKGKLIEQPIIYVAEKGEFYAHGETIKKAIEDLNFKIAAETLKKEPINKDTKLTIKHYRLITGACELGVKDWMQSNKVEEGIKAIDLLPILEKTHAYGLESFKKLITF